MSKTSPIQRLNVLKEWLQQMEREGNKTLRRRKKVIQQDEDETPTFKDE